MITKNSKCSICSHQAYISVVDEKTGKDVKYFLCKFHYDEYIDSHIQSCVVWINEQKAQHNNMKKLDSFKNDALSNNTPV